MREYHLLPESKQSLNSTGIDLFLKEYYYYMAAGGMTGY